jgi:hypothetical protein
MCVRWWWRNWKRHLEIRVVGFCGTHHVCPGLGPSGGSKNALVRSPQAGAAGDPELAVPVRKALADQGASTAPGAPSAGTCTTWDVAAPGFLDAWLGSWVGPEDARSPGR